MPMSRFNIILPFTPYPIFTALIAHQSESALWTRGDKWISPP